MGTAVAPHYGNAAFPKSESCRPMHRARCGLLFNATALPLGAAAAANFFPCCHSCSPARARCLIREIRPPAFFSLSITPVFLIRKISNFGKNFFVHAWKTFPLEVFDTFNLSRYFLSQKLEKHELQRALICYQLSINNRLFKLFQGSYWLKCYFLHVF